MKTARKTATDKRGRRICKQFVETIPARLESAIQAQVMELLAADQPDKAIAEKTGLSLPAVKACLRRLRKRHKVTTRIGLANVVWARGNGYPKIPYRERRKVVQWSHELDQCA